MLYRALLHHIHSHGLVSVSLRPNCGEHPNSVADAQSVVVTSDYPRTAYSIILFGLRNQSIEVVQNGRTTRNVVNRIEAQVIAEIMLP